MSLEANVFTHHIGSRWTLSLWRRRSLFSSSKHHHHFLANASLQVLFSCLQRSLSAQGSSRVDHWRLSFSGSLLASRWASFVSASSLADTHYTDIFFQPSVTFHLFILSFGSCTLNFHDLSLLQAAHVIAIWSYFTGVISARLSLRTLSWGFFGSLGSHSFLALPTSPPMVVQQGLTLKVLTSAHVFEGPGWLLFPNLPVESLAGLSGQTRCPADCPPSRAVPQKVWPEDPCPPVHQSLTSKIRIEIKTEYLEIFTAF